MAACEPAEDSSDHWPASQHSRAEPAAGCGAVATPWQERGTACSAHCHSVLQGALKLAAWDAVTGRHQAGDQGLGSERHNLRSPRLRLAAAVSRREELLQPRQRYSRREWRPFLLPTSRNMESLWGPSH